MIYPCASVISVFHFRPVDIAEGWWTLSLTDLFIPCYSLIYSFSVSHGCIHSVLSLCPQPSAWTQIKKRNTDTTDLTRIGLSRISFFDIIWVSDVWIWVWFIWICECRGTPFSLCASSSDFRQKTWINPCILLRALRLDSCHTGRPYESKLSTVNLHDRNRWRHLSPPHKSTQAINQDKPAAQESCSQL